MQLNSITPPLPLGKQEAQMKKSSQEFESMFLFQMLELMTPEPDKKNKFTGGTGETAFRPYLNEEMAKNITQSGGIGVADYVYKQLVQYQEVKK